MRRYGNMFTDVGAIYVHRCLRKLSRILSVPAPQSYANIEPALPQPPSRPLFFFLISIGMSRVWFLKRRTPVKRVSLYTEYIVGATFPRRLHRIGMKPVIPFYYFFNSLGAGSKASPPPLLTLNRLLLDSHTRFGVLTTSELLCIVPRNFTTGGVDLLPAGLWRP